MTNKKAEKDYWFTIEPYVYVGLTNQCVLLYNTLDGETIESDQVEARLSLAAQADKLRFDRAGGHPLE